MECRELTGFIDAYLDGEFDAVECQEVEEHLRECRSCQSLAAAHGHLKELVRQRGSVSAPKGLRLRVMDSLSEIDDGEVPPLGVEDYRLFGEEPPGLAVRSHRTPLRTRIWRSAPLFASVGILAAFVWVTSGGFTTDDEVVEDAVRKHTRDLPMEVASPDVASIQGWARDKVDFNPRLPVFPAAMHPLGARLSHILDRPAVYLLYGEPGGGRKASLFVFADAGFDLAAQPGADLHVGHREVRIANRRGYNVVLWRDNEIVYSLVSDLDEATLVHLIEATRSR